MTDMIRSLVRRDPRYKIKDDAELNVTIERRDGSSCLVHADLLDLSVRGAKFKTKESIAVEDVVCVKIEVNRPKRIIAVSGRIRWVTPITGDDWWLGCAFDVPIEYAILHELAVSGILERRRYRRERVSVRTTAKWELNSTRTEVCILNYSPGGGFCMLSQTEGKPGDRVLLRFELHDGREVLVCGTARWQVESENGYVIGCEFLHTRNSTMLSELIESNSLVPPMRRDRKRKLPLTPRQIAGAALIAASGLLMVGFWWGRQQRVTADKVQGELHTVPVSRTANSAEMAAATRTMQAERPLATQDEPAIEAPLWKTVDGYQQPYGLPLYVPPRRVRPYADARDLELPLLEPTVTSTLTSEGLDSSTSPPVLRALNSANP